MSKLFDMNDFIISGVPKMYKENKFGLNIGIQIPGAPNGKYLWCGLSKVGKEGKTPFTEQEFLAANHITLVSYKMDSFKDKSSGATRYSTKASGQSACLGVDLDMNMGKLGGNVSLVNPNLHMIVVQVPFMGRDGSGKEAKPMVKHREVMVKWPEDQDIPSQGSEVFIMGSLRISKEGGIYIEAKKALVL